MIEQRINSKQAKIKKEKFSDRPSREFVYSLQSSIDEKSKIYYLD